MGWVLALPFVESPINMTETIDSSTVNVTWIVIDRLRRIYPVFVANLTKLQFLYVFIAVLIMVNSLVIIATFMRSRFDLIDCCPTERSGLLASSRRIIPGSKAIATIALFCAVSFLFMGTTWNYSSFLAPFAVCSGQSRQDGARLVVILSVSILVGAAFSPIGTRYFSPTKLLMSTFATVTVDFIIMSVWGVHPAIVIVGTVVYGLCTTTVYGQLFALLDRCLHLTNLESTLMIVAQSVGEISMTLVTGRLLEIDAMTLMYSSAVYLVLTDLSLTAIVKLSTIS